MSWRHHQRDVDGPAGEQVEHLAEFLLDDLEVVPEGHPVDVAIRLIRDLTRQLDDREDSTASPPPPTDLRRIIVAASIKDTERVLLTAVVNDAAGQPDTTATVAWAADSGSLTLTPGASDREVYASGSTPGTYAVTPTSTDSDGAAFAGAPFSVTVTSGDAAAITVTAGTPEAVPAAAASSTPSGDTSAPSSDATGTTAADGTSAAPTA